MNLRIYEYMNLRIYVKGYGLLCFDRNMSTNLSNKYGPDLFDADKKSALDTKKICFKRSN